MAAHREKGRESGQERGEGRGGAQGNMIGKRTEYLNIERSKINYSCVIYLISESSM
jgi:hypothetical protein